MNMMFKSRKMAQAKRLNFDVVPSEKIKRQYNSSLIILNYFGFFEQYMALNGFLLRMQGDVLRVFILLTFILSTSVKSIVTEPASKVLLYEFCIIAISQFAIFPHADKA